MKLKNTAETKAIAVSKQVEIQQKSSRGGARPGSGPKPAERKSRRSVGLSARQWVIYDELGGNDWLRGALDEKAVVTPKTPKYT